jgi:hypothetical protein
VNPAQSGFEKAASIPRTSRAQQGDYDLICIGSATWWLTTCLPIRSFRMSDAAARVLAGKRFAAFVVCRRYWRGNLKSLRKLATAHGGQYVQETHFVAAGGQIRSLLSLISYTPGRMTYRVRKGG